MIVRLHLGVGIATAPLLVAFHLLGTLSALLPLLVLLLAAMAVVGLIARATADDATSERGPERPLTCLAFLDATVILAAIHLGGGPEAAGLPFFVLPAVAFGGVLPRRATIALSVSAAAALAADFALYQAGWAAAVALPPGSTIWSRYAAIVTVSALAAATTTMLGERWRTQERAARRLARERGRVGELQARIVSTVSHELRTPLSVIQAAAGTLGRYGDRMTAAERTWRLKKIEDAVQATTRLIEDVLPLGEVGEADEPPPRTELAVVCAALLADMQAAAPDNVRLELVAAADAPSAWVDARVARRALRDLVANAIRYSPAGGAIRVEIAADPKTPTRVVLRVRDEGMGIPPDDRAFVFEPFYRGSNVDGLPGLGVGLSIAKREVEVMGGTLELEPSERGTSFVVSLPAGCGAEPARPNGGAPAPATPQA